MIRLFWKELRYNWWIVGLGCGIALLLSIFGDPLFFRGDSPTGATEFLLLIGLLIGLRTWSSELAGDTVQFLGSRPIRWWQVWIAKVVAGLLQVTIVFVVAGGLYALFVPEQYRPFLMNGITNSLGETLPPLMFLFGMGYVVSILMPGVPLAAAALVLVWLIMYAPFFLLMITGNEKLAKFAEVSAHNAVYLLIPAIPMASMVVARRLPQVSMRRRWVTWMACPLAALVIGGLLAVFYGKVDLQYDAPSVRYMALSPDGKWAVCDVVRDHLYLMDTHAGKRVVRLSGKIVMFSSWSSDSKRFAYRRADNGIGIVSVRGMRTALIPESVRSVQGAAVFAHRPSTAYVAWSPTGSRLALVIPGTVRKDVVVSYRVAVFSPDGKVQSFENSVPKLRLDDVSHYHGQVPALASENLVFWPSKDGGRFTPASYFEVDYRQR